MHSDCAAVIAAEWVTERRSQRARCFIDALFPGIQISGHQEEAVNHLWIAGDRYMHPIAPKMTRALLTFVRIGSSSSVMTRAGGKFLKFSAKRGETKGSFSSSVTGRYLPRTSFFDSLETVNASDSVHQLDLMIVASTIG